MHDPILHKILRGEGAERYLPFARTRLRTLEESFGRDHHFRQSYLVEGFSIEVQQQPPCQFIRIIGADTLFFEFETTGWPVRFAPSGFYQVGVISVEIKDGALTGTLMGNRRVTDARTVSIIGRQQQEQLLDEPVHYPGPKTKGVYPRAVYQTWAPHNPHTGIHISSYHAQMVSWYSHFNCSAIVPHAMRDVTYDVPWADGQNKDHLRYAYLRDPSDWPRASAIQTVVDPIFGTREFAIYVDAFDQVSVFPTAQIGAPAGVDGDGNPIQNVPSFYVKMVRVAFPSWVYAKTERFLDYFASHGDGGFTEFPDYDWKLHPDGTKMCAVVYERVAVAFDSAYYSNPAWNHPWDGYSGFSGYLPNAASWDQFNTIMAGIYPQLDALGQGAGTERHMSATGLVEVGIKITLTGSNPDDFALVLDTPTELRRPTTSSYCTLLAGYVWYDIMDPTSTAEVPVYQVHRGDLCVLDPECYGNNVTANNASLLSLKNLTAGTELRTFGAEVEDVYVIHDPLVASGIVKVLAYDMPTLSFAMKHTHKVRTFPEDIHGTPTGRTSSVHFGIGIYTMNRHREWLFPSTQDPAYNAVIQNAATADGRAQLNGIGTLVRMPVNDLRTWGDPDLDALRESYDNASLPAGSHFTDISPDLHANPYMITTGWKYEGPRTTPVPSDAVANWYATLTQGGRSYPFPIFNITDPRPGWYQYMGELMSRLQISPYTTFFAHPNGSWAFYNQEFIYNRGGQGYAEKFLSTSAMSPAMFEWWFVEGNGGDSNGATEWTCTVPLNPANLEHCIFDQVHLEGVRNGYNSSFVTLYNQAVQRATLAGTLLDDAAEVTLANLRATFSVDTVADSVQPELVYQSLKINWRGSSARLTDRAYFTGHKLRPYLGFSEPLWEFPADGLLLSASLGAFWTDLAATQYVIPQTAAYPATFSSCVQVGG